MSNSLSFDKVENSFIVEQYTFNIIPLVTPKKKKKKKKTLIEMMSHSAIRCLVSVLYKNRKIYSNIYKL